MNTQKIVTDLLDSGLKQRELAALVPCGQSTISAFLNKKRGGKTTFSIGNRLVELHKERCPDAPDSPPAQALA